MNIFTLICLLKKFFEGVFEWAGERFLSDGFGRSERRWEEEKGGRPEGFCEGGGISVWRIFSLQDYQLAGSLVSRSCSETFDLFDLVAVIGSLLVMLVSRSACISCLVLHWSDTPSSPAKYFYLQ